MTAAPRTEVVGLLFEHSMARCFLDPPTQRRCAEQLRGVEPSPTELAQADVLVEACHDAVRPAQERQCEARRIIVPHLLHGAPHDATWSRLWGSLSPAERERLLEIREWLREPIRSWLARYAGEPRA